MESSKRSEATLTTDDTWNMCVCEMRMSGDLEPMQCAII